MKFYFEKIYYHKKNKLIPTTTPTNISPYCSKKVGKYLEENTDSLSIVFYQKVLPSLMLLKNIGDREGSATTCRYQDIIINLPI